MDNKKTLDEQVIGDIILCDPITSTGKEALGRLGLTSKDVSPRFFYEKLRVASKYDKERPYKDETTNQMCNYNCLYYQYTVDSEQFELIKRRLEEFDSRFSSDLQNEYPLLMLGVAGNGKSIEINRRLRESTSGETEFECGRAYINLEDPFTKKTYGSTYECPDYNDPLWLFCIKLLDGIMQYIKHCHTLCTEIWDNFNNIIVKNNLANKSQIELFQNIKSYHVGDIDKETLLFDSLQKLLGFKQADKDIQASLEILMWIMYCSNPDRKNYIVIDNIEEYVKLNGLMIQIPDSDLSVLYKSINIVVTNVTHDFNRIEENLGWRAFKIVVVLRRTSIGLLDSALLQAPVKGKLNINDVTGHFQIPDIWVNKKRYIWEDKLRNRFSNENVENIFKIIEFVMSDGPQVLGTSYQSIIAPLMSYGIRRNARSQAHSIWRTYELLSNNHDETITFDEFETLMSTASRNNPAVRYMFRRALLEFQFKWSISTGDQNRWKKLNLGHLVGQKNYTYGTKNFIIETVAYSNCNCVTLLRRILTFLSCFPETSSVFDNGKHKLVVDMFATLPLYNLIKGVLVNPTGRNTISDDDFLQLAKVLIALSDMSNGDTRSAPYIILGIKDRNFHANAYESVLGELLKKIWQAGVEKSLPGEIYNCSDFGVRITDAGHSFLLDWQASFSFIASLHCFTIPPLFFLKDISTIKYVIDTVYKASAELCKMYENEAARFCGRGITLRTETYLPRYNENFVTFKQRVKELHINHLNLYRTFLETNYKLLKVSEEDMKNLTMRKSGFISKVIAKYETWETESGAPECF